MAIIATKRELQLELEIYRERMNGINNGVMALNLQAQSFQEQATQTRANIARIEAELKASYPETTDADKAPAEAAPVPQTS